MHFVVAGLAALQAAIATPPAPAPSSPASSPPSVVEGVTVEATRPTETLRERVGAFVAAAGRPSGYDQLARWRSNDVICVRALGFQPAAAAAIQTAVETEARRLKLPVGRRGCEVDVLVVGSPDPVKVVEAIQRRSGPLWGREGPAAMMREIAKPAAVRWWRVTATGPADGSNVVGGADSGMPGPPTINGFELTHLHKMTRESLRSVVVLVDARRIAGVTIGPLADYVAMGVFAPVPTPPEVGQAPTVLRLFKPEGGIDPTAPVQLTDWDLAYLKGLYDADPSEVSSMQDGGIQVSMLRSLAVDPPPGR